MYYDYDYDKNKHHIKTQIYLVTVAILNILTNIFNV